MQPDVSIVIPVYNEEGILREAVTGLRAGLRALRDSLDAPDLRFEIIIAENGSSDRTVELAEHLVAEPPRVDHGQLGERSETMGGGNPAGFAGRAGGNAPRGIDDSIELRTFSLGEPNYGKALRRGILEARGRWVICDEIDLCDSDFHRRALELLRHGDCDFVVGSKAMKGANDHRPLFRRAATRVINGMLRAALDFRGTDTHGLKAFHRETVMPVVEACVIDRDLFASELVIRAGRAGLRVVEIPIHLAEKRPPAINLVKRVPRVLSGLARLTWAIRFKQRP